MTQEERDLLCKTAHVMALEIWDTEHMACRGNLELKMQELIKRLLFPDVPVEKDKQPLVLRGADEPSQKYLDMLPVLLQPLIRAKYNGTGLSYSEISEILRTWDSARGKL